MGAECMKIIIFVPCAAFSYLGRLQMLYWVEVDPLKLHLFNVIFRQVLYKLLIKVITA